jgi:hypothetical protein
MSRTQKIAYFGLPMLFCLGVHWLALKMWFFTDDFAWLGLRMDVHTPADLIQVLFGPQAQGTVRTLSERLFFLVFSSIFGLHSPPFRVWVFLTQFANIALLIQITRRLTGSPLAAFLAPVLWSANAGIALSISWSSAYNEVAFAFTVLLGFRLFLLYIDTGRLRFWIWQWVVFLLGFLVLELNVMYPALICGYALCFARRHLLKSLFLFIPSVLFTVIHFGFIPANTGSYYKMYFDSEVFAALGNYWVYALGAMRDPAQDWRPAWLGLAVTLAISVALAIPVVAALRRRDWLPAFLLGWFLVMILPVLPLKNHFTIYYITVPAIGIAILAAWALARISGRPAAVTATVLAALYLMLSIADIRMTERYYYDRSRKIKYLMTGIQALPASTLQGKSILLKGIDSDLFWIAFPDNPFRLLGIYRYYLVPGSEKAIERHPEWTDVSQFAIDEDEADVLLRTHRAAVLELNGRRVRDLTPAYAAAASADYAARHPGFVDVADPFYQSRLGAGWYAVEGAFRWMPKTASVSLAGPQRAGQVLEVTGYCPAVVLAKGPLDVVFLAGGIKIGAATLKQANQAFDLRFPLPAELVGKSPIEITVEVSRVTLLSNDVRPLGLIFGTFAVR